MCLFVNNIKNCYNKGEELGSVITNSYITEFVVKNKRNLFFIIIFFIINIISIKFDIYGYSVKKQDERLKNVAYTLFPDLKNIDNLLNEFFDNKEKIELMKYILTESSKKLKSELRNNDEYIKGVERGVLI